MTEIGARVDETRASATLAEVTAFLVQSLNQSERLVQDLPPGVYARRVEALGGSIGGHLRHSLEHVEILLGALDSGEVFFERRSRDGRISEDPDIALETLRSLRARLQLELQRGRLDRAVTARSSLSGDLAQTVDLPSSLAREMVYVGLHYVHHLALVATAARLQGCAVDPDLGKAPATLYYERCRKD